MKIRTIELAAALGVVSVAGLVAGCAKDAVTGPTSYIVSYQIATTGGLTIDSVKYDNGHGTLIKVVGPAAGWTAIQSVNVGGSVEALAWGVGAPSSSAKLKVTWTASGFSSQSDSSIVVTTSPASFALSVPHRGI